MDTNKNIDTDITQFLATGQVETGSRNRERRTKMIDMQDEENWEQAWLTQKKGEDSNLTFRFNDFTEEAQQKFIRLLKKDTSLRTVRYRIEHQEIKKILNLTNPITAKNYYNTFCLGSFNRYREQQLSSLIYHANRNCSNFNNQLRIISRLIAY